MNVEFQDLGDDKESYRWTNLIVSNRTRDDYSRIIELGKALDRSGVALARATQQVMDVDQWMRAAAYQSLVGAADAYFTGSNVHNFRLYVRPDGKVLYLPWDWDSAFQLSNSAALVGTGRFAQVVRLPANLRLFYGHMLDIVDRSFNREYMDEWTRHYGQLAGRNFASRLSYIDRRTQFVAERIGRDFPPMEFSVTTPETLQVGTPVATVEGRGWVDVREIRLAGGDQPLDVVWQASAGAVADSWQARFPVAFGTHTYTLEAYDYRGNRIASKPITIESTDPQRPVQDFLRVSELHYHPSGSEDSEFIELTNISSGDGAVTFDMTGVSIAQGPSEPFTFAGGTTLAPGDFLLVVNDQEAFQAAYPHVDLARIAGQYQGDLANSGERLALLDSHGNTVLDFPYGDGEPWPERADGRAPRWFWSIPSARRPRSTASSIVRAQATNSAAHRVPPQQNPWASRSTKCCRVLIHLVPPATRLSWQTSARGPSTLAAGSSVTMLTTC